MLPFDAMMCLALLTGPEDPLSDAIAPASWIYSLRESLADCAESLEIMDVRERPYILGRDDDIYSDVRLLRRRHMELLHAPHLWVGDLMPDSDTLSRNLAFNRQFRQELERRHRVDLGQARVLQAVMHETDNLHRIWDLAHDAMCGSYYIVYRRQALRNLREVIGEQAIQSGLLPPHIPIWRFQSID
jgi:hypothetical protein